MVHRTREQKKANTHFVYAQITLHTRLLRQQCFYHRPRHPVFTRHDVPLLVYEHAKGNAGKLELLRKVIPLVLGQIDVLALDAIAVHELLAQVTRAVFLIAQIKEAHRLVPEVLHIGTLVQHTGPTRPASQSP